MKLPEGIKLGDLTPQPVFPVLKISSRILGPCWLTLLWHVGGHLQAFLTFVSTPFLAKLQFSLTKLSNMNEYFFCKN
jgi:hypothetical protein